MQTVNFSLYIVIYNFVVGVLLMIASEKLGIYVGHFAGSHRARVTNLARLVALTFGACVAILSIGIYLAFYVFKLQ